LLTVGIGGVGLVVVYLSVAELTGGWSHYNVLDIVVNR